MLRTKTEPDHYHMRETCPRLTSMLLTPCQLESELPKSLTQPRQLPSVELTVPDAGPLIKQSANLDLAIVSLSHMRHDWRCR